MNTTDVDNLFSRVSNTSVRFQVTREAVVMLDDPTSALLDRARADFFQRVFEGLHQERGLPIGLDFVVNMHDEPLFRQSLETFHQPPIFSFCPGIDYADIPMVNDNVVNLDFDLAARTREEVVWSSRSDMAFWRGSTTGGWYTLSNWQHFPRTALTMISQKSPGLVDALFVRCAQCDSGVWEAMQAQGLCQLGGTYPTANDLRTFKYLVDIDGNACSFRFLSLLGHGAVVFKVQPSYTEFFDPFVVPYVHYIPVKGDMSDLIEKIEWARHHDEEASKIAMAGLEVYEGLVQHKRWEEYMHHVLTIYHSLFKRDAQDPSPDEVV